MLLLLLNKNWLTNLHGCWSPTLCAKIALDEAANSVGGGLTADGGLTCHGVGRGRVSGLAKAAGGWIDDSVRAVAEGSSCVARLMERSVAVTRRKRSYVGRSSSWWRSVLLQPPEGASLVMVCALRRW
jgi:hypothetical protein